MILTLLAAGLFIDLSARFPVYQRDGKESLPELISTAHGHASFYEGMLSAGWEYQGLEGDDYEDMRDMFTHPEARFPGVGPCMWGGCFAPATNLYGRHPTDANQGVLGFCDNHNRSPVGGGWEGWQNVTDAVMAAVKEGPAIAS